MNFLRLCFLPLAAALAVAGAGPFVRAEPAAVQDFGTNQIGRSVKIYSLRNIHGCEARITNYGGIIVSLTTPDRYGKMDDVVLGFDRLEDYLAPFYLKNCPYFGALIGRYCNRIAQGKFSLDGHEYNLARNDGGRSTLHGGTHGFDKCMWSVDEFQEGNAETGPLLKLSYISQDGEEGFPGRLKIQVVYTLSNDNALKVVFEAASLDGKDTIINLTQHSYFNLKGAGHGDILDHELMIKAAKFVPIDAHCIPLGDLRPVAGTPFDFNRPTKIGARINDRDEQLKNAAGYDQNFVLDDYVPNEAKPRPIARVTESTTGRALELSTDQPGVQFYTGNHLSGIVGKGGLPYPKHSGFCLEPQHYPDSPNHPDFPSVLLKAGQTYHHTIVYQFSVLP